MQNLHHPYPQSNRPHSPSYYEPPCRASSRISSWSDCSPYDYPIDYLNPTNDWLPQNLVYQPSFYSELSGATADPVSSSQSTWLSSQATQEPPLLIAPVPQNTQCYSFLTSEGYYYPPQLGGMSPGDVAPPALPASLGLEHVRTSTLEYPAECTTIAPSPQMPIERLESHNQFIFSNTSPAHYSQNASRSVSIPASFSLSAGKPFLAPPVMGSPWPAPSFVSSLKRPLSGDAPSGSGSSRKNTTTSSNKVPRKTSSSSSKQPSTRPPSDKRAARRKALLEKVGFETVDPDTITTHDKKRLYLQCLEEYVMHLHSLVEQHNGVPVPLKKVEATKPVSNESLRTLLVHMQMKVKNIHEQQISQEQEYLALRKRILGASSDQVQGFTDVDSGWAAEHQSSSTVDSSRL